MGETPNALLLFVIPLTTTKLCNFTQHCKMRNAQNVSLRKLPKE